jgi:pyruvate dehydrogenase E1 component beta subunit
LLEEFGPERIRDTPLSELGFVGAGIGAALGGMRPIVEVMTVNFSLLALDQIVNTARRCATCRAGSSRCRW